MKEESNKLLLSTIKRLLYLQAHQKLTKVIEKAHPVDLAYVLDELHETEQGAFFAALRPATKAAVVLTEVHPATRNQFLNTLEPARLARLLEAMDADDVADLVAEVDDETRREELFALMGKDDSVMAQSLMEHDPESAGGLMVPDFFALTQDTTVAQALRALQEDAGRTEVVSYLYVINEHNHLVGVTSLRALVLARPERLLAALMLTDVIRVTVDTDQEEVARLIARYNLIALPVVDGNNQLVGVVTVDDIIDVIRHEATEDMMLMAGANEPEVGRVSPNPLVHIRARAPGLWPSFALGSLLLLMLWATREDLRQKMHVVALLPLVMMMAGGVGRQSATIVSRGISLGHLDLGELGKVVVRETMIGGLVGGLWALALTGISGALFFDNGWPTLLSVVVSMVGALVLATALAALIGALLPTLFSRFGLDPAASTGPLALAIIHVFAVCSCLAIFVIF